MEDEPGPIRVLIGKFLPDSSAVAQTLAGRRKRLRAALRERLAMEGWREVGLHVYVVVKARSKGRCLGWSGEWCQSPNLSADRYAGTSMTRKVWPTVSRTGGRAAKHWERVFQARSGKMPTTGSPARV